MNVGQAIFLFALCFFSVPSSNSASDNKIGMKSERKMQRPLAENLYYTGHIHALLSDRGVPLSAQNQFVPKLLDSMDTSGNGAVSQEEFEQFLINSKRQLKESRIRDIFDELDESEDGKLTLEEYNRDGAVNVGLTLKPCKTHRDLILREKEALFTAADVNGDEKLDFKEFELTLFPTHHDRMIPAIRTFLTRFDLNGDSALSCSEILKVAEAASSDRDTRKKYRSSFINYDTNKNGKLESDELTIWTKKVFQSDTITVTDEDVFDEAAFRAIIQHKREMEIEDTEESEEIEDECHPSMKKYRRNI